MSTASISAVREVFVLRDQRGLNSVRITEYNGQYAMTTYPNGPDGKERCVHVQISQGEAESIIAQLSR